MIDSKESQRHCFPALVTVARLRAETTPFGGQAHYFSKMSFFVST